MSKTNRENNRQADKNTHREGVKEATVKKISANNCTVNINCFDMMMMMMMICDNVYAYIRRVRERRFVGSFVRLLA